MPSPRGLGVRCRSYLAPVALAVALVEAIYIAERGFLSGDLAALAAVFGAASPGCGGGREVKPAREVAGGGRTDDTAAGDVPGRQRGIHLVQGSTDYVMRPGRNGAGDGTAGLRRPGGSPLGSDEWHEHWTHAYSSLGIRPTGPHDDFVTSKADSLRNETLAGLASMERRYEDVDALPDYRARGLGWVEDRLGMVLTVVVVGGSSNGGEESAQDAEEGRVSVYVVDVVGDLECGGDGSSHPPLTMWVRAMPASYAATADGDAVGPADVSAEMFAGTALPHRFANGDPRCAWRYDFQPERAGSYSVHVKLLTYNGFADFDLDKCNIQRRTQQSPGGDGEDLLEHFEEINRHRIAEAAVQNNWTHSRGVSGFKLYSPDDACCEACTRARGCRAWTTPGSRHFDNCQLYFDRVEDDVDFLDRRTDRYLGRGRSYTFTKQVFGFVGRRRRRLQEERRLAVAADDIKKPWGPEQFKVAVLGTSRSEPTAYFLGCGWSSLMSFESPCHDPSDDLVFGSGVKVDVRGSQPPSPGPVPPEEKEEKRPCTLDDERVSNSFAGRWVQYPYPDDGTCSALVPDQKTKADFRDFRAEYFDHEPPLCWHRDDITKHATVCVEPGCQFVLNHRWKTSLRKQKRWYGRWEQEACEVMDISTADLQKCVDEKRIGKIDVRGKSIANIIKGYMVQR